jgi:hypothetical protein
LEEYKHVIFLLEESMYKKLPVISLFSTALFLFLTPHSLIAMDHDEESQVVRFSSMALTNLGEERDVEAPMRHLKVSFIIDPSPEDLRLLITQLSSNPTLETLDLANCKLNNKHEAFIRDLGNLLKTTTTLKTLDLRQNPLGWMTRYITEALPQNTSLKNLNLDETYTKAADIVSFNIEAELSGSSLNHFSFRDNKVVEGQFPSFVEALNRIKGSRLDLTIDWEGTVGAINK